MLASPNIVGCHELFLWEGRVYAILELMEGGSMTSIVTDKRRTFGEDFIKFSLYSVALGL